MRFFSARVSFRAASIFLLTSGCSRRASSKFSARVPIPSSLDTCSSLWRLVMESVPIRACEAIRWMKNECNIHRGKAGVWLGHLLALNNEPIPVVGSHWREETGVAWPCRKLTCVGGCWMANPRSSRKIKGRAGRERNFFQISASRLQGKKTLMNGLRINTEKVPCQLFLSKKTAR